MLSTVHNRKQTTTSSHDFTFLSDDIWKNSSFDDASSCSSNTPECSSDSASDVESFGSDDSTGESNNNQEHIPPCMTQIYKHKRLQLAASTFSAGCICGHEVEHRDIVYETRKRRNGKSMGVTIRPKTPALSITLRT